MYGMSSDEGVMIWRRWTGTKLWSPVYGSVLERRKHGNGLNNLMFIWPMCLLSGYSWSLLLSAFLCSRYASRTLCMVVLAYGRSQWCVIAITSLWQYQGWFPKHLKCHRSAFFMIWWMVVRSANGAYVPLLFSYKVETCTESVPCSQSLLYITCKIVRLEVCEVLFLFWYLSLVEETLRWSICLSALWGM